MATKAIKKIYRGVVSYLQYWRGNPVDRYYDYGVDDKHIPFYVENITGETETLRISHPSGTRPPVITMEKSSDMVNWEEFGTTGGSTYTPLTCDILPGERLYLRATSSKNAWCNATTASVVYNHITGVSKVGGNILSLLYGSSFNGHTSLPSTESEAYDSFGYLFYNNTNLRDAKHLKMASTLKERCYLCMFYGCTNLKSAPVLPVSVLLYGCYARMFYDCTSLKHVECHATDITAENCLFNWMNNVPASGTFVKKASATFPEGSSGIPSGWTIRNV